MPPPISAIDRYWSGMQAGGGNIPWASVPLWVQQNPGAYQYWNTYFRPQGQPDPYVPPPNRPYQPKWTLPQTPYTPLPQAGGESYPPIGGGGTGGGGFYPPVGGGNTGGGNPYQPPANGGIDPRDIIRLGGNPFNNFGDRLGKFALRPTPYPNENNTPLPPFPQTGIGQFRRGGWF